MKKDPARHIHLWPSIEEVRAVGEDASPIEILKCQAIYAEQRFGIKARVMIGTNDNNVVLLLSAKEGGAEFPIVRLHLGREVGDGFPFLAYGHDPLCRRMKIRNAAEFRRFLAFSFCSQGCLNVLLALISEQRSIRG